MMIYEPPTTPLKKGEGIALGRENGMLSAIIDYGSILAVVVSYTTNKSVGWAALHGLLSWFYVIYAALNGVA
jgi:hypothetical protein